MSTRVSQVQQIRLTAPDLKQPSADQFNFGWSGQVTPRVGIDVDYVHSEGHDEIHRWRINTAQNVNTRLSPAGIFDPIRGPFIVEGNRGHSRFDGLYVTGKVRMPKASVISTYSWSQGKNLANDFNTLTGDITNANWEIDWGPTPNDIRHRFTTGASFQLPMGLQYATSLQANTGKPFNPITGARRHQSGRSRHQSSDRTAVRKKLVPRGRTVQLGYAVLQGDSCLGGSKSLEVMFDVFNITNHANFDVDQVLEYLHVAEFRPADGDSSKQSAAIGVRLQVQVLTRDKP